MIRWHTGSQCRPTRTGVMWPCAVAMSTGDLAGCRVLCRLESPKINISDPGQNRVAVIQSTTNEGLD